MKNYTLSVLGLIPLLTTSTFARPQASVFGGDSLVSQRSKMTAFTVTEDGQLTVECWEVSDMLPAMQVTRKDGSKGTVRQTRMADKNLEDVSIWTWPPYSPMWPPPTNAAFRATAYDLGKQPTVFAMKKGLIQITPGPSSKGGVTTSAEDPSDFIFSPENGDDWFYLADNYEGQDLAYAPSLEIQSVSGSDTTLLAFQYKTTPDHKVLHKGACNFAGLADAQSSSSTDHERAHLTVQVDL